VSHYNCNQRAGLYAGWELLFVRPQPLLIENIKLNLKTNPDSYREKVVYPARATAWICNLPAGRQVS